LHVEGGGQVGDGAAPAVSLSSTCQSGGHRPNTAQVDQQRLERSPTRPPTVALTPIRHEPLGDLAGQILNRHPRSSHPTRSRGFAPPAPAEPPPQPSTEPVTVQRRVSATGVVMVAWRKITLGRVHAGKTVTIHVKSTTST
jgi:hypothetical protein